MDELASLKEENKRLLTGIKQAADDVYQWNYGRKNKNILDIYDDLLRLSRPEHHPEGTGENGF